MERIIRCCFISLLSLTLSMTVFAKSAIKVRLLLDHINIIQTVERGNDELYFDMSVYHPDKTINHIRIPNPPLHWPSKVMENISKLVLWSGSIEQGKQIVLLVALMDADMSPLNPDDTIGSVRVILSNQKGVLKTKWQGKNAPIQSGKIHRFDLKEEGHYQLFLSVDTGEDN